ncbi:MAG TPA: T9SS type A sorting domain-containing protein, partial [Ignavibacteriaceae bacterium]|nr:T9SS type A sorting domain-containing protein [Ignavibacteriaceae bacterium]
AFNDYEIDSLPGIKVTFNLNTSTHLDTISLNAFVQLRGELKNGPDSLASGEKISWNANSGVILKNIEGDYWQSTVRLMPGTELDYRYWIGHDSTTPASPGLGWEGPVISYDSEGNYRKFIAGIQDTVLLIEYFNPSGDTLTQYWRPFEQKADSIAVRFKVNMGYAASGGNFNPETDKAGVKGDPLDSINILSWDETKVILSRESLSINNGSFWSGTAYYPKSAAGLIQAYKFFIDRGIGNIIENIPERIFTVPEGDTTLAWVYFNNRNIITNTGNGFQHSGDFILYQNYPNPFNPSTKINFEIKNRTRINLTVFNFLGEKVKTLADEEKDPGKFSLEWTGKDSKGMSVSSGIYFIRLTAGTKTRSIKVLLLK